jgi:hypothetical protein
MRSDTPLRLLESEVFVIALEHPARDAGEAMIMRDRSVAGGEL